VKSARAAQLDQPHTSRCKADSEQPHGHVVKGLAFEGPWTSIREEWEVKVAVDTETLSQKLKDPVAGQRQHPVVVHQACDISVQSWLPVNFMGLPRIAVTVTGHSGDTSELA